MQHGTIQAIEIRTRFLHPFVFDPDRMDHLRETLSQTDLWETSQPEAKILKRYGDETLPGVIERYLGTKTDARYFRLKNGVLNSWFPKGFSLIRQGENARLLQKIGLTVVDPSAGIELFLCPDGAGVMSITMKAGSAFGLESIRAFNYRLAQGEREQAALLISVPEPAPPPADNDSDRKKREERATRRPPFLQRRDGFILFDVASFLIEPLTGEVSKYQAMQDQFSVYSTIWFPGGIGFTGIARPEGINEDQDVAAFAAAISQVEEPAHAFPVAGWTGVPCEVFTTHHMCAASSLGACHLFSSQGIAFDPEKVTALGHKWFVPFLAAMLQRLTLTQIGKLAAQTANASDHERPSGLMLLQQRTLRFVSGGHFVEVSQRDALNRFYSMCQKGQRVHETLRVIQSAITDLHQGESAAFQIKQLNSIDGTQRKIEWIEVFVISFYATELTHVLGELAGLRRAYILISVLIAMFFAAGISLALLRPADQHSSTAAPKGSTWRRLASVLALITAFLGMYLWAGTQWFKGTEEFAMEARLAEQEALSVAHRNHPSIEKRIREGTQLLTRAFILGETKGALDLRMAVQAFEDTKIADMAASDADAARERFHGACPMSCLIVERMSKLDGQANAAYKEGDFTSASATWSRALQLISVPARKPAK